MSLERRISLKVTDELRVTYESGSDSIIISDEDTNEYFNVDHGAIPTLITALNMALAETTPKKNDKGKKKKATKK